MRSKTHNFRVGVWLIGFVLIFSSPFFFLAPSAQARDCQLVNILTDKNQVGLGESMQVNITAKKECIGHSATIKICDQTACADIAPQIFESRRVNGQEAINPIVFSIVPTDFLNKNTTAFVQATVPFNTVKSQPISIVAMEEPVSPESNKLPNNVTAPADNVLSSFPGQDLQASDVLKIVVGLSCWLTRVAFTLAIIFVILAGFRFMAAQGNQTKYGEAVKNFQTVLLGILVIYGVYVIIATVAHAVGITDFSFIPLVC